ncbi:MAG: Asp23/Gls24 family envelope stress response protein [Actinomycetota bacterium]|nr:Asp23/Gls24 family envelope stress response protein [Actinomycetota bacterium]
MTDTADTRTPDAGATAGTDAGERGSLQVAAKAIERIATHTAALVDGVLSTESGLDKLVGRGLPKASSDVHGDRVRINVDIAVQWPRSVADVARAVRRDVHAAVSHLAGMRVLGVDVSVAHIERQAVAPRRRVQ